MSFVACLVERWGVVGVGSALVVLRVLGYRGSWPCGRGFDAAEGGEAGLGLAYFVGVVSLVLCVVAFALGVYVRSWVFCAFIGVFVAVTVFLLFLVGKGERS